jgi:hypothetical protein
LEVTSAALFMLWAALQLSSDEVTVQWNPLFPPMVVFAGLVLLQLASTAPKASGHTNNRATTPQKTGELRLVLGSDRRWMLIFAKQSLETRTCRIIQPGVWLRE